MRTFVAIALDEATRAAALATMEDLRPLARGARFVREKALHLTLKFIGELAETDLPQAVDCLGAVAAESEPFSMTVVGLSGFPPHGVPRVLHVGVEEPTGALAALHDGVERALAKSLGVPMERRHYVPHVTLARVRDRSRTRPLEELVSAVPDTPFGEVAVTEFVLMQSDLTPAGAIYSSLHRFGLA